MKKGVICQVKEADREHCSSLLYILFCLDKEEGFSCIMWEKSSALSLYRKRLR